MVNIAPLSEGQAESHQHAETVKQKPKMKMYNARHKQRDLDRKKYVLTDDVDDVSPAWLQDVIGSLL